MRPYLKKGIQVSKQHFTNMEISIGFSFFIIEPLEFCKYLKLVTFLKATMASTTQKSQITEQLKSHRAKFKAVSIV